MKDRPIPGVTYVGTEVDPPHSQIFTDGSQRMCTYYFYQVKHYFTFHHYICSIRQVLIFVDTVKYLNSVLYMDEQIPRKFVKQFIYLAILFYYRYQFTHYTTFYTCNSYCEYIHVFIHNDGKKEGGGRVCDHYRSEKTIGG